MSSTAVRIHGSAAVVDASAFYELITNGPLSAALTGRVRPRAVTLHAPALVDVEVLHALRRNLIGNRLSTEAAETALAFYRQLPIERYPHDDFIDRIWQLRASLTVYDATYFALAEILAAPLITLDARLAKAAPPTAHVELFA